MAARLQAHRRRRNPSPSSPVPPVTLSNVHVTVNNVCVGWARKGGEGKCRARTHTHTHLTSLSRTNRTFCIIKSCVRCIKGALVCDSTLPPSGDVGALQSIRTSRQERVRFTDLCVEDGEGPGCVQRDQNPNQELLMLGFQRQRKAIDDAVDEEKGFKSVSLLLFFSFRP